MCVSQPDGKDNSLPATSDLHGQACEGMLFAFFSIIPDEFLNLLPGYGNPAPANCTFDYQDQSHQLKEPSAQMQQVSQNKNYTKYNTIHPFRFIDIANYIQHVTSVNPSLAKLYYRFITDFIHI